MDEPQRRGKCHSTHDLWIRGGLGRQDVQSNKLRFMACVRF